MSLLRLVLASLPQFPLTAYMVAGTQAARKDDNKLVVMKVSDLHRTKYADGECKLLASLSAPV